LGNVLAIIDDRKLPVDTASLGYAQYYLPNIIQAQDYYPFGMVEPGRQYEIWGDSAYRYGFNGQMKDNDIYGQNNVYTAQFWEYDPRLGRRWDIDPATMEHPYLSPYACFADNPVTYADPNGRDSVQRAKAVEKASEFKSKSTNTSKSYGGTTGGPGDPVDCAQMVASCIVAGGESNPKNFTKAAANDPTFTRSQETGVDDIIRQPTIHEVQAAQAQVGNIITFNDNKHVGIITDLIKDDKGIVVGFTVIGSQSSTGPAEINVRLDKKTTNYKTEVLGGKKIKWADYWSPKVGKVYKWDTKPDTKKTDTKK
jgi:RHS repeat-associated protein